MTMLKAGDPYVCCGCGGKFLTTRDDVEAMVEFEKMFPLEPRDEAARVCDDCFNAATARILSGVKDIFGRLE